MLLGILLLFSAFYAQIEEPTIEEAPAEEVDEYVSPRDYLYSQAPDIAVHLDCIIRRESDWTPGAKNSRSSASGLAQFLNTTWASTPQGQAGISVYEPYANVDGAIWLYRNAGPRQWEVVTKGLC